MIWTSHVDAEEEGAEGEDGDVVLTVLVEEHDDEHAEALAQNAEAAEEAEGDT